ncbi:hypothetical protein Enr10x_47050 [Gimesia panareensis]|uniref:Uncharacterized protein n=1 Tax=Gimesia panareensis TaxID=2527978 RepID=A0A517QCK3_9PLAN|nr:hypothetical protein [Gimesia panareensis]QDT29353.1 hypothetical protein Enr10x_47050 [Gimesia panareensis]
MQETRYTEKQILCGLYSCYCDAIGSDTPFTAETRVDQHMQADGSWEDTDLADLFYRFERQFDFECSLEEWTEELGIANVPSLEVWEHEMAPRFTFGAIARFIQKRAINTVSFQSVTVINRECGPAGAFYGIQQVVASERAARWNSHRFAPSDRIIDVLRGSHLDRFWYELHWRTELRIPRLKRDWDFLIDSGCLLGGIGFLVAFPASILTGQYLYAVIAVVYLLALWAVASVYKYCSDPLPPELQTFRDLAVAIAGLDCEAVRGIKDSKNGAAEGLT